MGEAIDQCRALQLELADFSLKLSELKNAVARLAKLISEHDASELSGDRLEAGWTQLRSRHEQLRAGFTKLAESAEDAMDLADALAARAEGGQPVPLEELKAELGLQ